MFNLIMFSLLTGINWHLKTSRTHLNFSNTISHAACNFINVNATGDQKLMSCPFSSSSKNIIVMQHKVVLVS